MLCDNKSVVTSTGKLESTLAKKHNFICWHAIREAIAHGWLKVAWEPTDTKLADLLTKALPGNKRVPFLKQIYQQVKEWEEDE